MRAAVEGAAAAWIERTLLRAARECKWRRAREAAAAETAALIVRGRLTATAAAPPPIRAAAAAAAAVVRATGARNAIMLRCGVCVGANCELREESTIQSAHTTRISEPPVRHCRPPPPDAASDARSQRSAGMRRSGGSTLACAILAWCLAVLRCSLSRSADAALRGVRFFRACRRCILDRRTPTGEAAVHTSCIRERGIDG